MLNLNEISLNNLKKKLIGGILIILVISGIGSFILRNNESSKNIDAFDNLPRDERLQYSQFIIDQTVSNGVYDLFYGEASGNKIYAVKSTPASVSDEGQTIWDGLLFNRQIACLQTVDKDLPDKPFDTSDAEKVLSSVYYRVGKNKDVSGTYVNDVKLHVSLRSATYLTNKYIVTNTSELREGLDSDGNTVEYKIITYLNNNNETYYLRAIINNFENYDGTQKNIWLYETISPTIADFPPID